MADTFHKFIRKSISNDNLQIALDANAAKRIEARENAFASLPDDLGIYRQRAKQVRQDVINNLDRYLEQFTQQAASNGIIIHRAVDAAEAVQIVLDIAKQTHCKLIAKSKTMVSEEIGLNHALESEGYKVVETDLGEYIIQLRGEPPAHIITPAVHLRKEEVGETFAEQLDIPYTVDIATMTSVARERLRQTFLQADLGISGVNFGVAESGSLCLVTNEGNGRMVTTLPRVHIALMGIERLVPTMKDLALMLQLLPRSATGQKMTVYTTIINSPRKDTDPDGPEQRHLILVDNGRQTMRTSPLAEGLLCIRCGACLNACPVFREIGGHAYVNESGKPSTYPGPIGSIVSPGLFGQGEFDRFARASTLCGACKDTCPVDIDLPQLLLRVRAGGVSLNSEKNIHSVPLQVKLAMKFYTWMAAAPKRFSGGLKLAGFFSNIAAGRSNWLRLQAFTGWGYSKDLRSPSKKPFRSRWAEGSITSSPSNDRVEGNSIKEIHNPVMNAASKTVEDTLQRFSSELTTLSGKFSLCSSEQLGDLIISTLQELGVNSILSWDDMHLPVGLLEFLRAQGIRVEFNFDPDIKVGLSGVEAGIADTGTIVLPLENGKPQFTSLIPEFHLAVVRAEVIADTIEQVFAADKLKFASMSTLITGPSRTADIEMTLTIGVHGPRYVHVFCIQE